MLNAPDATSTRPYLLRALHEWCTDNGYTPYVTVLVDETVQVPMEYVKNGEIVLNVSYDATSGMTLGNEFIEFKARFAGKPREIMVPIHRVQAIYARENGQGMAFPTSNLRATDVTSKLPVVSARPSLTSVDSSRIGASQQEGGDAPMPPTTPPRPTLTRVK
ncbi:ClpXP protease specificity-enhancing factor [Limnohabitans sp. B9-3]|nr:ClpXP protease specificity-enhancing factor [Limnohabitans sp. B9-3]PIT78899.1 ClpXP protease specificity-enhancing factor [Limnohabitans sp. B9-3]